ncbi:hypothetical protein [Curtobacterium sp. KT1]|uniref:hypothetical protein n=1 Tax=Curtobacterium sp. KT1 TaxID=3372858 RepID=UPI0037C0D1ED
MQSSSWTDPAVVVQIGASLVAIGAVIVVIVQAVYTRKALQEAGRSRETAEAALEVARAEHRNGTFLAIEAVRARISVNAPSAELHVDEVEDRLYSPSVSGSGFPEAWTDGYVFHVKEANMRLTVRAKVSLLNTGSKATRFVLYGALRTGVHRPDDAGVPLLLGTEPGPEDVLLEPGERHVGYFEVTRSLQEWIEVYDARADGDPGPEAALEAYVDDGLDTGASYTFAVVIGGPALIPERPGLRETWLFAGLWDPKSGHDAGIGFGTRPIVTRAWLSKTNNIAVPDGPLTPDTAPSALDTGD